MAQSQSDQSQSDEAAPVVVGVDDTAAGKAAMAYAVHTAGALPAPLRLVHGYNVFHAGAQTLLEAPTAPELVGKQILAGAVEHAADLLPGGAPVESRLKRGPVARCLIEASIGAALLVVGRHEPAGLGWLGNRSLPARLAAEAHCPVVVVPSGWTPSTDGAAVTVGIAVPARSHAILEEGFRLAAVEGRPLRVLHLWRPTRLAEHATLSRRAGEDWSPRSELQRRREIEATIARIAVGFPDVTVGVDLEPALASRALAAASRSSALLVLGRHDQPRSPWPRLGTVAGYVLRTSRCPVVLVPPELRRPPRGPAPGAASGAASGAVLEASTGSPVAGR